MSNFICPVCGSSNIQTERRLDGFRYCMECRYSWAIGASQQKQTVFDHITESVEALVEKLVYCVNASENGRIRKVFRSTVCDSRKFWYTEIEAIAATIEELKKECKENE